MIETMAGLSGVKAFFSIRHNGKSVEPYGSLNVAFHVGDNKGDVEENHALIKKYFNEKAQIFYMNQVHSNEVCTSGSLDTIPYCDALITDKKDQILMVMVADCVPILFFDAKLKLIAAVHAGRAGAFKNIVAETVSLMKSKYQSKVEDIRVSIGPHIHACCYEIGKEITTEALSLGLSSHIEDREGRFYLNLHSIITDQLFTLGFNEESVDIVDFCTSCHVESFFSYRKEGKTGRFCGVIMLE